MALATRCRQWFGVIVRHGAWTRPLGVCHADSMLDLPTPQQARDWCEAERAAGRRLGYVATMGALHQGHLSLMRRAVDENDSTCVSIFVNPLQFNDVDDFERYPRDLAHDRRHLEAMGVSMCFVGTLTDFFPGANTADDIALLDPGPFAAGLEGEYRPGHLQGVCTIVDRLFRTVGPCRTYFGEKDFQQTLVVRGLARRLGHPDVVVCPTVREPSGLALSSRNALLSEPQKRLATCLHAALMAARRAWERGERNAGALREIMRARLDRTGISLDYADLRDPEAWSAESPQGPMARAQALIAVTISGVRLIDNMRLDKGS